MHANYFYSHCLEGRGRQKGQRRGGGRGEQREGDKEKEREKKREEGVPCLRGGKEERQGIRGQTDMDREAEAETERNDQSTSHSHKSQHVFKIKPNAFSGIVRSTSEHHSHYKRSHGTDFKSMLLVLELTASSTPPSSFVLKWRCHKQREAEHPRKLQHGSLQLINSLCAPIFCVQVGLRARHVLLNLLHHQRQNVDILQIASKNKFVHIQGNRYRTKKIKYCTSYRMARSFYMKPVPFSSIFTLLFSQSHLHHTNLGSGRTLYQSIYLSVSLSLSLCMPYQFNSSVSSSASSLQFKIKFTAKYLVYS